MVEAKVWESLVPRVLRDVRVPVLATAAAPILVHPPRPVVLLTPGAVPPVPILARPPGLPLLDAMAIRVEVLVPLVTPFRPSIALRTLSPLVGVLCAATKAIILLAPSTVKTDG